MRPLEIPERFNMADYFLYDRLGEGLGEKVALRTREGAWTYAEVAAESNRVGNALRALGLTPEERVLIALPDVPAFAFAIFGTLRTGGVVAMANPLQSGEDLAWLVGYTRCRALVADGEVASKLAPHLDDLELLRAVLVTEGEVPDDPRFHAWRDAVTTQAPACEPWPTHRDDPAYWLFTSGSTGRPKAAMHLHHDFPWNCERYAKQVIGMKEDDVTLAVPRLYFGYATGTNLFFPFAVGATACLFPGKPTPEVLLDHIEHFRPTVLTSVPTSLNQVLAHEGAHERDLSSLRCVLSAGEALPAELYERWTKTFNVEILDGIGSAESFHIYISNAPGDVTPGSLGRVVPGYEAMIVDDEGQPLPDGEVGRLRVRGDSVAVGYWQAHEASKETFAGDWLTTADLFRRDAEGRFWYAGRADDILKVGGMFVSPLEIEDALLAHEAVHEVCLVPYTDAEGLAKPLAFVVLHEGHAPDEATALALARHCKETLARYKFPRRVAFLDRLPRNDRDKADRKALRAKASDRSFAGWFDTGTETQRAAGGGNT